MHQKISPKNIENKMRENDFIVSKTDLKGHITYCNRVFIEFAKYSEEELLGAQHNIIRHPDMPRCIYKLMWDTIKRKEEINAYVKNLAKDGSFYWVHANVTPVMDNNGDLVGYYSVRRKPREERLEKVKKLYHTLLGEENKFGGSKGMQASEQMLQNLLNQGGKYYEEFIFAL
jgi:PAS domain S-box-containing protein